MIAAKTREESQIKFGMVKKRMGGGYGWKCHAENVILLQTAIAVSNLPNTKPDSSVILFDTGSQRSFILTELRKNLNLPTIQKESVYIKVFGKSEST